MSKKVTTPEVAEENTTAAATQDQGLSLNDITACVSIIDIVTKRGAFEGSEMADVGAVRNRLATFLAAAKTAQEESNPTTEAETPVNA